MSRMIKALYAALGTLAASLTGCEQHKGLADVKDPVVLGEISTYAGYEAGMLPYKKGWTLALEQANSAGGIAGRQVTVESRDDASDRAKAIDAAEELIKEKQAAALFGTAIFGLGNDLSDIAEAEGVPFLASLPMDDSILSAKVPEFTYRLRATSRMQAAMLAHQAARLPATRWAIVAPNYPYGWDAVSSFKSTLKALRPDIVVVEELAPTREGLDAVSIISALNASKPEAVFNAMFGVDLFQLVDHGVEAGFFDGKVMVSMISGEPEYARNLSPDALKGLWIVSGYPSHARGTQTHAAFLDAYVKRYEEAPNQAALIGYSTMVVLLEALAKAEGFDRVSVNKALENISVVTPAGPVSFRRDDHQSTLGTWVGKLGLVEGEVAMVDYEYLDGADFLPVYQSVKENSD